MKSTPQAPGLPGVTPLGLPDTKPATSQPSIGNRNRALAWGVEAAVPAAATAAWGARAIAAERVWDLDLVWDRQSFSYNATPDRDRLLALLHAADSAMRENYKTQRQTGHLCGDQAGQVTLVTGGDHSLSPYLRESVYIDPTFTLVADTRASYGYVYLTAWILS